MGVLDQIDDIRWWNSVEKKAMEGHEEDQAKVDAAKVNHWLLARDEIDDAAFAATRALWWHFWYRALISNWAPGRRIREYGSPRENRF